MPHAMVTVRRALRVVVWVALAIALPCAGTATARARFDTRVLAHIPEPGYPALSLVGPDGTIYVGTFENPAGDSLPSKVFAYGPHGGLERTYTVRGQDLSQAHGVQTAAVDARGKILLLDQHPARVLVLNPRTGGQRTYARFRDVPTCTAAGRTTDCSDTVMDNEPEPDYGAWGAKREGSLYVTDYLQGLIWRVPPGGGKPQVWFTDPRIDGAQFGPAGIQLLADHHTLLFDNGANGATSGLNPTTGSLWRLPIRPDGTPGTLTRVWESRPAEAPDGFAVAKSGDVYLSLVAPGVNQIVELSATGQELARYPDAVTNATLPVPFDEPSSVIYDGSRLLVTNQSFAAGDHSHMVLFDIASGEPGLPVFVPTGAGFRRSAR